MRGQILTKNSDECKVSLFDSTNRYQRLYEKITQNKQAKTERTPLGQAQPANEQDVSRRAYEL
jgi:hypothetical protein